MRLRLRPCGNYRERYEEEVAIFETDFGRLWTIIGILTLFLVTPFVFGNYSLYIMNHVGIYTIGAIGLNILIGFTGQISLGHGAFFGVGAYTASILMKSLNVPFPLAIFAGGIMTSLVGLVFGIPSSRLKHLYLTISTLAGQFILEYLFIHWQGLTGGTEGIILPEPTIFGFTVRSDRAFFYVIFVFFVLFLWLAKNIVRTRYGRAFIAIRDNDQAAQGMGIPIFRYKLLSFAISSFYAGFAGGLWATYMGSITPEPFGFDLSIGFIAMIIIGGLGSITGSVLGAGFITLLNELLSQAASYLINIKGFGGVAMTVAPLREFFFGLIIVLFLIFEPKGIAEVWRIIKSSFKLWPFSY